MYTETVDGSEIPRPTTWDGVGNLVNHRDFNYQPPSTGEFTGFLVAINSMDVSENNGTPKPSILIWVFHDFHHPFWGSPVFGNTRIFKVITPFIPSHLLRLSERQRPLPCRSGQTILETISSGGEVWKISLLSSGRLVV